MTKSLQKVPKTKFLILFTFVVVGLKPRILCRARKGFTTGLHPELDFLIAGFYTQSELFEKIGHMHCDSQSLFQWVMTSSQVCLLPCSPIVQQLKVLGLWSDVMWPLLRTTYSLLDARENPLNTQTDLM